jgi:hypothetical protein
MTIPATGTSWRAGGYADVDSRFNTRGGLAAIGIRMNRGSATNISPFAAGSPPTRHWSPFALDGNPRDDLWAVIRVNGEWVTNPDPNEGFWLIGAMTEDGGPERAPDVSNDNQMILQSNAPFDSDLTEENMAINFTGVETLKPLLKRLRMNLALSDSAGNPIVEDPGSENFSIGKPVDNDGPEYQLLLFFARRKNGRYLYTCEAYSLCKLNNIGSFRRSKTDPDAGELGYMVLPDPYFVGKDPNDPESEELVPILYNEWTSGEGWTAIGGLPVFGAVAPVATGGAGTATLVLEAPTGAGDPFTYTVEQKIGAGTWTAVDVTTATLDDPDPGDLTLVVDAGVGASSIFRVTATGTNGATAVSQSSNAVTIT